LVRICVSCPEGRGVLPKTTDELELFDTRKDILYL
jgi:hypothetical protein